MFRVGYHIWMCSNMISRIGGYTRVFTIHDEMGKNRFIKIEFRSKRCGGEWSMIPNNYLKRVGISKAKEWFERSIQRTYGLPKRMFRDFFEGSEYRLLDKDNNILLYRKIE